MEMVSLRDYEGIQGFGIGSSQEVDELNKALSAGTQRPPTSGGNVLRVESLEATLRVVTFSQAHIKFWRLLPKLPAYSTVEEYNRLTEYGADAGAFTNEGDLPETQDSTYERKTALVKFLGTTREVTHPMTLVRPAHGNVIALETQNGAIWLLERLERALFGGRSDNIPQEIDGLSRQILDGVGVTDPNGNLYSATDTILAGAETVIIDKRGQKLTEDDMETATNFVVQNYGLPTDLFIAPKPMSELAKAFYPRERVNLPAPTDGKVGFAINQFVSQAGLINFQPNIFLRSGRNNGIKTVPTTASSAKAPNAPSVAAGAAAPDAQSMFKAADAGTYYYRVTAVNRYGESAGSADSGVITHAAGTGTVLTITDGGGTYPATAYRVYRSAVGAADGSKSQFITILPKPGGAITVSDRNWWLPGTCQAYLVQNNLQNYSVRQLAPMLKIPLATIAASIRWMQLLYLTFILYTPKKNVIFINVLDS